MRGAGENGTPYIRYEYNIDGQRTKKTVTDFDTGETTTTEYFYNSGMLMGQKTGNDVLVFMYDENGDIFGFTYNGTPYYYVKNAQNDVFVVTDADGQAVVIYLYDAWGDVAKRYVADGYDAIAQINPILYRSYYCDLEFGFYYLNTRYYVPAIHRFLNADSYVQTGQGMLDKNLFTYCLNNPIYYFDSDGTTPIHRHTYGYCPVCGFPKPPSSQSNASSTFTNPLGSYSNSFTPNVSAYEEHQKRGTTNPANRNKHENANARRQRDNRGEKGDARRRPNANKRRQQITINTAELGEQIMYTAIAIGATACIVYFVVNDVTGVGVADDAAIAPMAVILWDSAGRILA